MKYHIRQILGIANKTLDIYIKNKILELSNLVPNAHLLTSSKDDDESFEKDCTHAC